VIESHPLSRQFEFNGVRLPDIDEKLSPEEIRTLYSHQNLATGAAPVLKIDPQCWKRTRGFGKRSSQIHQN